MISGTNYGKPYPPPGGAAALPRPNPPRSATPQPVQAETAAAAGARAVLQPNGDGEWARVFEALQKETADAHRAFQETMAASHQAFLRMAETALPSCPEEASPCPPRRRRS